MAQLAENVFDEQKRSDPPRRAIRLDVDPSSSLSRHGVLVVDDEILALRGIGAVGALVVHDLVAHPRSYSVIRWNEPAAGAGLCSASALDINFEVMFVADPPSAGFISTVPASVPERLVTETNPESESRDARLECSPDQDAWGLRGYKLAKAARAFLGEAE